MKVLQLIDSLNAGGAERMSVNLANELCGIVAGSFLCATRKEGVLKETLLKEVGYLFLDKKGTLDVKALFTLLRFVKKHEITIIHAHSSSFFFATLIKLLRPNIALIWHDHYGNSELLAQREHNVLQKCSRFFQAIIAVNENLKQWNVDHLKCDRVYFLKNFVSSFQNDRKRIQLEGAAGTRIICLANLRPQKDHITLLKAYQVLKKEVPLVSLHLVGGETDNETNATSVKKFITTHNIEGVHLYGEQDHISAILQQADIGVLSSVSEGLPVSLLEYGLHQLAVVTTNVGACKEVIGDYGIVVPPKDATQLANALKVYIENPQKAVEDGAQLREKIEVNFSFKAIEPILLSIYKNKHH